MGDDIKRIKKEVVNIDYGATSQFFNKRAELVDKIGKLSVTMYQDNNPELTKLRDEREKKIITPLLGLSTFSKVIDIGCGVGRWGFYLIDKVESYIGTDFSSGLIEIAQRDAEVKYKDKNIIFQVISCTELSEDKLILKPPFSIIIVAGVFSYLNDSDCINLLKTISQLASQKATVYIREPIATEDRLTLHDFYSNELNSNYNAIYRTEKEYLSFFSNTLINEGFNIVNREYLYSEDLENRAETRQKYFILKN